MLKSNKFTLLAKHDFRTIKGKQVFAIYFPNVDFLMIKGKHIFAIYFPNVDFLMIKGKHFLFFVFTSFGQHFRFLCVRFYYPFQ